ncbi:MAG: hypothetical protein EXQ81_07350 [Thermoleophilia bacterium]|nr:hypothetical protein [Thermoleophilia bacterium]
MAALSLVLGGFVFVVGELGYLDVHPSDGAPSHGVREAPVGASGSTDPAEPSTLPEVTESAPSSFYDEPTTVPAEPGTLIRSEPLEYPVVGGQGFRVIYTSIDAAGAPIAVSGMSFMPDLAAPAGGRHVLSMIRPGRRP